MRKMTPEWRLVCVLWILSALGAAGIVTAMAYKPQNITIQKKAPTQNINRVFKSDKINPSAAKPQPKQEIIRPRKFWYA